MTIKNNIIKLIMLNILAVIFICFNTFAETSNASKQDLNKFSGYKVKFDYQNYSRERKLIYNYYTKDGTDNVANLKENEIGIDIYDINNDGKKEILVYIESSQYCGSAGCQFEIFRQDENSNYLSMKLNLTVMKDIKILETSNKSYKDIFFETKKAVWSWNGDNYELKKVLN